MKMHDKKLSKILFRDCFWLVMCGFVLHFKLTFFGSSVNFCRNVSFDWFGI